MKTSPNSEIPLRILGHTGEKVSAIGLGGFHIGARMTEDESFRIIRYAIDSAKIEKELGWRPQYDLERLIEVEW